jgi:hypothetical protein
MVLTYTYTYTGAWSEASELQNFGYLDADLILSACSLRAGRHLAREATSSAHGWDRADSLLRCVFGRSCVPSPT